MVWIGDRQGRRGFKGDADGGVEEVINECVERKVPTYLGARLVSLC